MLKRSKANLGEVAVGLLAEVYAYMIQNILHIHRKVSFRWETQRDDEVGHSRMQRFEGELLVLLLRSKRESRRHPTSNEGRD